MGGDGATSRYWFSGIIRSVLERGHDFLYLMFE